MLLREWIAFARKDKPRAKLYRNTGGDPRRYFEFASKFGRITMISENEVIDLLLQTARILEVRRNHHELRASEWAAMRLLARANEFSRTPSALANFLGTTRATASHVVKTLEEKGHLTRDPSAKDGRSTVLRLTPKGENTLAHDPIDVMVKAIATLDPAEQVAARNAFRQMLTYLTAAQRTQYADVCRECIFLLKSNTATAGSDAVATEYKCSLFRATIEPADLDLLCTSFQVATTSVR
jgi:MarR family transcriptional regulator, negative regulator of the multidrug operon emrRAB